jgi:hypothetical protein
MSMNKPLIRICNCCADLFPEAKAKLGDAARAGEIRIGPGICLGHQKEMMAGWPEAKVRELLETLSRHDPNPPPDLREHPELVQVNWPFADAQLSRRSEVICLLQYMNGSLYAHRSGKG